MTEVEVAALLRALAIEARLLRQLLALCAAASPLPPSLGGPLVQRAMNDLQRLGSRAEALAEFVVLG
jgi:hypothetical protein